MRCCCCCCCGAVAAVMRPCLSLALTLLSNWVRCCPVTRGRNAAELKMVASWPAVRSGPRGLKRAADRPADSTALHRTPCTAATLPCDLPPAVCAVPAGGAAAPQLPPAPGPGLRTAPALASALHTRLRRSCATRNRQKATNASAQPWRHPVLLVQANQLEIAHLELHQGSARQLAQHSAHVGQQVLCHLCFHVAPPGPPARQRELSALSAALQPAAVQTGNKAGHGSGRKRRFSGRAGRAGRCCRERWCCACCGWLVRGSRCARQGDLLGDRAKGLARLVNRLSSQCMQRALFTS